MTSLCACSRRTAASTRSGSRWAAGPRRRVRKAGTGCSSRTAASSSTTPTTPSSHRPRGILADVAAAPQTLTDHRLVRPPLRRSGSMLQCKIAPSSNPAGVYISPATGDDAAKGGGARTTGSEGSEHGYAALQRPRRRVPAWRGPRHRRPRPPSPRPRRGVRPLRPHPRRTGGPHRPGAGRHRPRPRRHRPHRPPSRRQRLSGARCLPSDGRPPGRPSAFPGPCRACPACAKPAPRPVPGERPPVDLDSFRHEAHRLADWMADYLAGVERLPVRSQLPPGAVAAQLPDGPPAAPEPFPDLMADLERVILPGLTHWQHPRFLAYFPANSSPPSLLAEMLTAAFGAQCMLWQTSPAATELEARILDWLRQMIGLPEGFAGVIQDSASSATLCAILTARERATGWRGNADGLRDLPPLAVYCSEEAHSSAEKAVRIAGLGSASLRKIPTDAALAMRPDALAEAIRAD